MLTSAFKRYPFTSNGACGAGVCVASDAFAQHIESTPSAAASMWTAPHVAFDRWRLCYSGLIGATFSAVIYPIAYTKLDAVWPDGGRCEYYGWLGVWWHLWTS